MLSARALSCGVIVSSDLTAGTITGAGGASCITSSLLPAVGAGALLELLRVRVGVRWEVDAPDRKAAKAAAAPAGLF